PSGKPSSSESRSSGFEPRSVSSASLRPSPSVSVLPPSSAPLPAVGSVSLPSTSPLRFASSLPSLAPPPSVSHASGDVVEPGSASARQLPRLVSVSGLSQSNPSSVPSNSASLSLSTSSTLMSPSPSVS